MDFLKSDRQVLLEAQGCDLQLQDLLANHEIDPLLPCSCGRPKLKRTFKSELNQWFKNFRFLQGL